MELPLRGASSHSSTSRQKKVDWIWCCDECGMRGEVNCPDAQSLICIIAEAHQRTSPDCTARPQLLVPENIQDEQARKAYLKNFLQTYQCPSPT